MIRAAFWILVICAVAAASQGAWWMCGGFAYLSGMVALVGMFRVATRCQDTAPVDRRDEPTHVGLSPLSPAA